MGDFPRRIRTSADKPYDEAWPRELSRRARSGELLRIRHGCYVDAQGWGLLEDEERYRGMLAAMTRTARRNPLFGAETAGVLWGFPQPNLPSDIQVIVPLGSGRRSSNGVRRITRAPSLSPAVELDHGMRVTDKIQTAVELSLVYDFPSAVAVMDRLLSTKPLPAENRGRPVRKAEVEECVALLPSGAKRRKVRRVLQFSDGRTAVSGDG